MDCHSEWRGVTHTAINSVKLWLLKPCPSQNKADENTIIVLEFQRLDLGIECDFQSTLRGARIMVSSLAEQDSAYT
jgi:hypothetical protein